MGDLLVLEALLMGDPTLTTSEAVREAGLGPVSLPDCDDGGGRMYGAGPRRAAVRRPVVIPSVWVPREVADG